MPEKGIGEMNMGTRESGGARRSGWMGVALCLSMALGLAGPAVAQEHFDVLLYEDAGGNLASGAVDVDTAGVEPDTRVLEGELLGDTLSGTPTFAGEDPGFFSFGDGAVPPSGTPPGWPAATRTFRPAIST